MFFEENTWIFRKLDFFFLDTFFALIFLGILSTLFFISIKIQMNAERETEKELHCCTLILNLFTLTCLSKKHLFFIIITKRKLNLNRTISWITSCWTNKIENIISITIRNRNRRRPHTIIAEIIKTSLSIRCTTCCWRINATIPTRSQSSTMQISNWTIS